VDKGFATLGLIVALIMLTFLGASVFVATSFVTNTQKTINFRNKAQEPTPIPSPFLHQQTGLSPLRVTLSGRTSHNDFWSAIDIKGKAPLKTVDLQANVSGFATGTVRYRFDCNSDGTWEKDIISDSSSYLILGLCSYLNPGNYLITVKVDRQNYSATDTLPVKVTSSAG